jgi:hypothetical protein
MSTLREQIQDGDYLAIRVLELLQDELPGMSQISRDTFHEQIHGLIDKLMEKHRKPQLPVVCK